MILSGKELCLYSVLSAISLQNLVRQAEDVRTRLHWPADTLERFRLDRCKRLLLEAGVNVPHYRDVFRETGFDPGTFRSFADLSRLPVLTRDLLRTSFSRLQHTGAGRPALVARSTGGTTGQPVTVLLEPRNEMERMLVTHRTYALMGRRLGDPTLLIAGTPIDYAAWTSFRDAVKNRLLSVTIRSSFQLDRAGIESLVDLIRKRKFRCVIAFTSVFDILCSYLEGKSERLEMENIVPCAELVTEAQRERWKAAFGAEVFEIYGSREMVSIAGETRQHSGLLVNSDIYHVEITGQDGAPVPDGHPGMITVTSLLEQGMPLIRYQLGDVGILLPSAPGSDTAAPILRITHGRVLDIIRTVEGKLLPGEFFPHLMKEVRSHVNRYQVVQTEIGRIVIRVVKTDQYDESTTQFLRRKIAEQVGPGMEIEFEFVSQIEPGASGKFRPTISLLGRQEELFR